MAAPCPECRLKKKRVFLNLDKAREEAQKTAIANEQTQALYKEGKTIYFTEYATAAAEGRDIIEVVSRYS